MNVEYQPPKDGKELELGQNLARELTAVLAKYIVQGADRNFVVTGALGWAVALNIKEYQWTAVQAAEHSGKLAEQLMAYVEAYKKEEKET